jgi:hypothetical protein
MEALEAVARTAKGIFNNLRRKIDAFRNEFRAEIERLDQKITSLQTQMEFLQELPVLK